MYHVISQHVRIAVTNVGRVRPIKWVILFTLIFFIPLLAVPAVVPPAAAGAYCSVCPSQIITTLATTDTEQFAVKTPVWADVVFGV